MKRKIIGILVCMLLIGTTGIAVADWDPEDGHKMHFPQMPDPIGWDVSFHDWFLADDWQCSEEGPVTDIHFWISWRHDDMVDLPYIKIAIYSNDPGVPGGYSKPLEILWSRTFEIGQFVIRGPFDGNQGWLDPATGQFMLSDHFLYWQINIKDIEEPFIQIEGEIYWLVIQMPYFDPPIEVGWKTSLEIFMDNAVWGWQGEWMPLFDPITQLPINFAFVITGGYPKIPNLTCNGTLDWPRVNAGSTVTGSFTVSNVGDPGSLLDWEVSKKPTWGNWTFTPASGTGLAAGSSVTVSVSVVSPPQKNKLFTGTVEVRNKNNHSDNCTISVKLQNPRTRIIDPIFINLLQRFFSQFPALRWILNPN